MFRKRSTIPKAIRKFFLRSIELGIDSIEEASANVYEQIPEQSSEYQKILELIMEAEAHNPFESSTHQAFDSLLIFESKYSH